ncbi:MULTISPECIES: hypothetical protein [unclassified Streptomyces]|uniref:hypothetical protein n=1 Tax=unclassified Streptomyces TaxID=2593676 RepID=UPI0035DD18D1
MAATERTRAQVHTGLAHLRQVAAAKGLPPVTWDKTWGYRMLDDAPEAEAPAADARRITATQTTDAYEQLKRETQSSVSTAARESRLEIYATALNQLALEHAALSGRDADAARVRTLPRRRQPLP